jgi:hypothetical protein
VDQRALDAVIDEELSTGDYGLTGGELGALVVIDAVARLVPGVLGSDESSEDESFTTGLLEYPQYTRPADFRGQKVPGVLLGGNHADITAWRREQSLALTLQRRPELLDAAPLDDHDRAMLSRLMRAGEVEALLDERGVACERLPLMVADRWPRAWFAAFVPEASRKAAKKQCFSGRRHRGFLWQAFSMGFIPDFVEGDAAWERWQGRGIQCCLLCLPENGLLYRLPEGIAPEALARFGCAILADEALAHTWMQTGSPARGPYYCDTNRLHP